MLTLVPARGGSKRIARKNVKSLARVPLILWTLLPFRTLDPVVSSDDPEILDLARKHGFKCIERPTELSQGEAGSSVRTALHAMEEMRELSVLLLQPTSPFRDPGMIENALLSYGKVRKAAVAVKRLKHVFIGADHQEGDFITPTGSCYVASREDLEKHGTFIVPDFNPIWDDGASAFELDTPDEWEIAEAIAVQKSKYLFAR